MSRQTIKQLNTLLKVAKNQEDLAAKEFKNALTALLSAKRGYQQLEQYGRQYHHKLIQESIAEAQSGLSWQQHTQFMASIDQSKQMQVQKIAEDERRMQARRKKWLALNLNRRKIEILLKKQEDSLQEYLNKKEEKALDDLINQYHMRSAD